MRGGKRRKADNGINSFFCTPITAAIWCTRTPSPLRRAALRGPPPPRWCRRKSRCRRNNGTSRKRRRRSNSATLPSRPSTFPVGHRDNNDPCLRQQGPGAFPPLDKLMLLLLLQQQETSVQRWLLAPSTPYSRSLLLQVSLSLPPFPLHLLSPPPAGMNRVCARIAVYWPLEKEG